MNKFTYSYPTKVYFGEGSAAEALGAELGRVGSCVMLACGDGSIKKNGVYDASHLKEFHDRFNNLDDGQASKRISKLLIEART